MIRISVGTEHIDDIIYDFEQSFAKSAAAKTSGSVAQHPAPADPAAAPAGLAGST